QPPERERVVAGGRVPLQPPASSATVVAPSSPVLAFAKRTGTTDAYIDTSGKRNADPTLEKHPVKETGASEVKQAEQMASSSRLLTQGMEKSVGPAHAVVTAPQSVVVPFAARGKAMEYAGGPAEFSGLPAPLAPPAPA